MKNLSRTENRITEGSIPKGVLLYFFPIFIGSMFQQLYNTADTVIVGRFVGTQALASVGGSAGQVSAIMLWLLGGISSGATVTAAQHYGAKNFGELHRDIHNGYALAVIGSVLFAVCGIIFIPSVFRLMDTPEELMQGSLTYVRIIFAGLPVSFLYNMGSGILRALGDSKRPLYYLIICCVINIVLDLLFVVVFRLSVVGVALATVLAQCVSAVLVTINIMRLDPVYALRLRKIRIYADVMKAQLRIGLPGGFQSAMYGISNIIIQTAINGFGTSTIAAYTTYSKLDAVYWLVSGAFGLSATTFVGQNFGAKNMDRVKKGTFFTLAMECGAAVLLSALLIIFARPLFSIFTKDESVIEIGCELLRTITPFYLFYSCANILGASLRGMGRTLVSALVTLTGICLFRVAWIYIAVPLKPELSTIALSFPISWFLTALLFAVYYLFAWKKIRSEFT
ncbi:MAG: MATE family efflux transporter [Lachnospiraceae bacterium]|nr:MATE family efflux transporter [Lachnospiraceae bacterium]